MIGRWSARVGAMLGVMLLSACGESDTQSTEKEAPPPALEAAVDPAAAEAIEEIFDTGKQIPLTPQMVEQLLAAWPEFKALTEKHFPEDGEMDALSSGEGSMYERFTNELKVRGLLGEFDGMARRHGFRNTMHWAQAWVSAIPAVMWSDPQGSPEVLKPQLEAQIRALEANPSIPADQKAQMLAGMRDSLTSLDRMKPIEENVAVVAPYRERFIALFDVE